MADDALEVQAPRVDSIRVPEDGVPEERWLRVGVAQVVEMRAELALRDHRISELESELRPDGQKRVLYSQYIAVAEALEQATKELEIAKSISTKRKDVLIEVRRLFCEARFTPAIRRRLC